MIYWDDVGQVNLPNGCVAVLGVFDGVHLGHQSLIKIAKQQANTLGLPLVVVTFDPNPAKVVANKVNLKDLASLSERKRLCAAAGADAILVIKFTKDFSHLSAEDFVDSYLVNGLKVSFVVVGENFRFGYKGEGDPTVLTRFGKEKGFQVMTVELVNLSSTPISSTAIRKAILGGAVAEAAEMLGRPYALQGPVVHGEALGRTLGYPTANIEVEDNILLPKDGVYSGWISQIDGKSRKYPCALSIGTKPTFNKQKVYVEAHILNFDQDIYGQVLTVEFDKFIREQQAFADKKALVQQIGRDVAQISRMLLA